MIPSSLFSFACSTRLLMHSLANESGCSANDRLAGGISTARAFFNVRCLLNWLGLLLIGSFFITGCSWRTTESHEDDHLPEHYPASYREAISRLEEFGTAWLNGDERSSRQHEQLQDMLNWLPEVAADSDLRKRDWERVRTLAAELLESLRNSTVSPEVPAAANSSVRKLWEASLAELAGLIPTSEEWLGIGSRHDAEGESSTDSITSAPEGPAFPAAETEERTDD